MVVSRAVDRPRAKAAQCLPLALLILCAAPAARAEDVRPVFFGGTCLPSGVQQASVMRVLRAELAPNPALPIDPYGPPITPYDVVLSLEDCKDSPPSVRIVLWQGMDRRERTVDLSDVPPDDWTRALALALAETRADPTLSRALPSAPPPWAMPPPLVQPVPAPPPPVPPPPEPPPPRDDERDDEPEEDAAADRSAGPGRSRRKPNDTELAIRAAFAFRYAPRTSTPGAGVNAAVMLGSLGMGASLYGARTTHPLGDVTLWVPAALLFYDLVEWGGYYRVRTSLELGAAVATGTPSGDARGSSEAAFHSALHAGVNASWPVSRRTDVEGAVNIGYGSSLRARANGVDVLGMDGVLLGLELGLRFH